MVSFCVQALVLMINGSLSKHWMICALFVYKLPRSLVPDLTVWRIGQRSRKSAVGLAARLWSRWGGWWFPLQALMRRRLGKSASAAQRIPLVVVPVSRGEVLIREGIRSRKRMSPCWGRLNESSAVSAWLTALGRWFLIVLLVVCVHWFVRRHISATALMRATLRSWC